MPNILETLQAGVDIDPAEVTKEAVQKAGDVIRQQTSQQLQILHGALGNQIQALQLQYNALADGADAAKKETIGNAIQLLGSLRTAAKAAPKPVTSMTESFGKIGSSVGTLVGATSDLAEGAATPISKIPVLNALFVFFGISGIAATGKSIYNWFTGNGKKKKKNK